MLTVYDEKGKILAELRVGSGYVNNHCVTEKVQMVQADGDEMRCIALQTTGVPIVTPSRITTWGPPWAQFIVENVYL